MLHIMSVGIAIGRSVAPPPLHEILWAGLDGSATEAYNNRPMDRGLDSLACQNDAIS